MWSPTLIAHHRSANRWMTADTGEPTVGNFTISDSKAWPDSCTKVPYTLLMPTDGYALKGASVKRGGTLGYQGGPEPINPARRLVPGDGGRPGRSSSQVPAYESKDRRPKQHNLDPSHQRFLDYTPPAAESSRCRLLSNLAQKIGLKNIICAKPVSAFPWRNQEQRQPIPNASSLWLFPVPERI